MAYDSRLLDEALTRRAQRGGIYGYYTNRPRDITAQEGYNIPDMRPNLDTLTMRRYEEARQRAGLAEKLRQGISPDMQYATNKRAADDRNIAEDQLGDFMKKTPVGNRYGGDIRGRERVATMGQAVGDPEPNLSEIEKRAAQIQSDLNFYSGEEGRLREELLNETLGSIHQRTDALKASLLGPRGASAYQEQLVDQLATEKLGELAQATDSTSRNMGQLLSMRGLGRGQARDQTRNEILLKEQEEAAAIDAQATKARRGIRQRAEDVFNSIDSQQKQITMKRDLAGAMQFNELGFQLDTNKLRDDFQTEMNNMQFKSNEEAFVNQLYGSMLGSAASIFVRGGL